MGELQYASEFPEVETNNKQEKRMVTADVGQTNLVAFDVIDWDNYQDGGGSGKSYAPPPEGRYTARAPIFKDDGSTVISATNSFGRTNEGYLKLSIDGVELLDGPNVGYTIRFQTLSSKKYQKRNGSQVLDFLRACGIAARPQSEDELRAALKMASGRTFQFQLIWEAYNKDTQESTSGQENFPVDPNDATKRLPYVVDEFDATKKWYANGKVRYFVSAVK